MKRTALLLAPFFFAFGCDLPQGGHGHDHGPAAEEEEDRRPGLSFTVYADGLELFMELPALVVGQDSPLIAHFTDARDPEGFVWVTEGKVTATLRHTDGTEEVFSVDKLLRNGIFKPIVTPTRPGEAELILRLDGPVSGTVSIGKVRVYATVDEAIAGEVEAEPAEPVVSYLKEAQWKTVYATTLAESATIRGSVRATGELVAPIGSKATLGSPVSGRLVATPLLRVGTKVRAGDVLARVVPVSGEDRGAVDAALAAAESERAIAEAELVRAEALHPEVVSTKALEAAKARLVVAERQVDSARGRRAAWSGSGGGGAELRSPVAGEVVFVRAEEGSVLGNGDVVVEIVDPSRLWLEARVIESDAPRVRGSAGAMFTVAGGASPVLVDASTGGSLLAVGAAVDPIDRTVPVVFELPNPGGLMPGSYVDVRVFTPELIEAIVIPATAIVDDGGTTVVYVMDGGEGFYKRRVTVGARDGDKIAVTSGLAAGERVVSRGAYEVLLSTSAGGIPAHGHQH
ncbi:MAG: efflux RND transporter periplasmic adaptor subunit [Deltaproteobacteria bacterium]|nr:efflux RND transporter periplasmic adaptor subunit [Deltaproteobacteria bacterium]